MTDWTNNVYFLPLLLFGLLFALGLIRRFVIIQKTNPVPNAVTGWWFCG